MRHAVQISRGRWLVGLLAVLLVVPVVVGMPAARAARPDGSECALDDETLVLTVGQVDCLRLPSTYMGAPVPVGYFIPEACRPSDDQPRPACPVLYYLHGTSGSYREGVGTAGSSGGAWVQALSAGPPVDPRQDPEPWQWSDTSTWVPKPALDLIIVSPHGATLPGGHGPAVDQDTGWFDWNPRYAHEGDTPRYATPPPQPASFLAEELVPFVDATFPTRGDRQHRAIIGYSQGGFGAYINGLAWPDIWSSLGMRSGGALPLVAPGHLTDDSALVLGRPAPADLPYLRLPGLVPSAAPDEALSTTVVSETVVGFGDPVADQAWLRQSNPTDLIPNARARAADGTQAVHLKHFVNDSVARRAEDYEALPTNYMSHVFETLLFPMNLYMEQIFDRYGVERTFHVGPGNHSAVYAVAYFREQLEEQYANLAHAHDPGDPRPDPVVFDYRTVRPTFEIWGWRFSVADREAVEFLNLTDVSCDGLTLRGSGMVEAVVPAGCGTGLDGSATFTVSLGPGSATDEMAGLGSSRAYGASVRVELKPLAEGAP